MAIKRIKIKNFKSFNDLELDLGNFNVVIGANASGKSNLTQIFKFIRDISSLGLDNAISLQGSGYLANVGGAIPKNVSLQCNSDVLHFGFRVSKSVVAEVGEAIYEFELEFKNGGSDYVVKKDELNLKVNYVEWEARKKRKPNEEDKIIGKGKINLLVDNGKPKIELEKPSDLTIEKEDLFPPFILEKLKPKTLLLQSPFFRFSPFEDAFSSIAIYDFDPKFSKKAVNITGKSELEEDGNNLPLVLKRILEDEEKKRAFVNLLKDILPFVEELITDKFADRYLSFKIKETYFKNIYFPASFISDGTVNICAILLALFFEKKSLVIVEEPERNIHPHLISKIVDMMKDASRNKQVIITTHSPEVVKHAGLENLLLISRGKDGFSQITKPKDNEEVKVFLENELGLDDLFVRNLLTD